MKSIKVAHLTSAHPDGDVRIFHKECVSLFDAGYDVTLIVPNTEKRLDQGVKIEPVFHKSKSRFDRMRTTVNLVYKKALEVDADIYHLHDPELLRIGLKLVKKGKKVIYDSHEDTPRQILAKGYLNPVIRKMVSSFYERFETKAARKLSAIVTATPYITERFIKINPNSVTVCNFPLFAEIILGETPAKRDTNKVCYIGGITEERGIKEMIIAAKKSNVSLQIAGKWSDPILAYASAIPGWENVTQLGFCSRDELIELKNQCLCGLVVLKPTPNHINSYPIKMFEYMAAGLPIISSDFPIWKSIIETHNCGICVDPLDPDAISKAIDYIVANPDEARKMGENGKKLVTETCNWDIEKKKLLTLYKELENR